MDFINIPTRQFMMGAQKDDPFSLYQELPAQEVKVTSFQITAQPISNREWLTFLQNSGYKGRGFNYLMEWKKNKGKVDPNAPVTSVCLEDVLAFCDFYKVKLPTEAQWESAADFLKDSGHNFLGLWQWCRDAWDEWYFKNLEKQKEKNNGETLVNPIISKPHLEKIFVVDTELENMIEYLSSFGVIRGCGEGWIRFDRLLRYPLKPSIHRRTQVVEWGRCEHLGFRVVYETTKEISNIISSWEEEFFEREGM